MYRDVQMSDSELENFKKSIEEGQKEGTLIYTVSNEGYTIEFNAQDILDSLESMGEIPLPMSIYNNLRKSERIPDFKSALASFLTVYQYEYVTNGNNLDSLKGIVDVPGEVLSFLKGMVAFYYDLDSPRIDFRKPFCWFRVKNNHVEGLKAIAKEQNPDEFKLRRDK